MNVCIQIDLLVLNVAKIFLALISCCNRQKGHLSEVGCNYYVKLGCLRLLSFHAALSRPSSKPRPPQMGGGSCNPSYQGRRKPNRRKDMLLLPPRPWSGSLKLTWSPSPAARGQVRTEEPTPTPAQRQPRQAAVAASPLLPITCGHMARQHPGIHLQPPILMLLYEACSTGLLNWSQ